MKKILFALALLASMQIAGAQEQVKSISAAKTALESAQAAAANPKKNTKMPTWLKLGQTYIDAYNAPQGNGWLGISKQDLALLGGGEKPISVEEVVVGGQPMTKEVYASRNYYFGANGLLQIIEVTAPVCENALEKAAEAFTKAAELDTKAQKTKDIVAGIRSISDKFNEEAYNAYTFGDMAKASALFEKSFRTALLAPLSTVDTLTLYNVGFTAWQSGNNDKAKEIFNECLSYGYEGNEGDVYAKLADIAEKAGDKEGQLTNLKTAFAKYPQSQVVLVGLINYYLSNGEDTGSLFELLDQAKINEPNNPSLYYVEGNMRLKLGEIEEAVAAYSKCSEINPNYEYGYIGLGILYYNEAVRIQEEAQNEFDDAKYLALVEQFEKTLKSCVEPFEKAFEISADPTVKVSVAEYLKNACFRFREDAEFGEKYEKFNSFVAENQ